MLKKVEYQGYLRKALSACDRSHIRHTVDGIIKIELTIRPSVTFHCVRSGLNIEVSGVSAPRVG